MDHPLHPQFNAETNNTELCDFSSAYLENIVSKYTFYSIPSYALSFSKKSLANSCVNGNTKR